MQIRYTQASAKDIEALYAFNKELIDRYEDINTIDYDKVLLWVSKKLRAHIEEYIRIIVDGEAAGYFHLSEEGGKMELDDLYLFSEYRGRGIGSAVIRHCCESTSLPVFLYVFAKNEGAIRLYERMGFEIVESVGQTRYIMERSAEPF